ncbi:MAG: alpha/beta hydrolase [Candidatus Nanoarchaeia archaeon]|nr:alpha/beta hydrolase [Candidatus Nanoarchaeia archaeon]
MRSRDRAKTITSPDGIKLFYWINQKSKEWIVLWGGSSCNHTSLEKLESFFSKEGYSTLIFDPRGTGFSDKPINYNSYSLKKHSDDLRAILAKESIKNPIFIGYSYSFLPIIDYVYQTGNARKVIGLCSSYNFLDSSVNKFLFYFWDNFLRYFDFFAITINKVMNIFKKESQVCFDLSKEFINSDFRAYLEINNVSYKEGLAHVRMGKNVLKWDVSKQLKNFKKPLLMIYADKDIHVRPISKEKFFERFGFNPKVEIVRGSHSVGLFYPERIFKVIKTFLR